MQGIDHVGVVCDGMLEGMGILYTGDYDMKHPPISPVYDDFNDFPTTYLVTSTRDLFLSDTVPTNRKMRVVGVDTDLNVYEGVSHGAYGSIIESATSQHVYGDPRRRRSQFVNRKSGIPPKSETIMRGTGRWMVSTA